MTKLSVLKKSKFIHATLLSQCSILIAMLYMRSVTFWESNLELLVVVSPR